MGHAATEDSLEDATDSLRGFLDQLVDARDRQAAAWQFGGIQFHRRLVKPAADRERYSLGHVGA